MLQRFENLAIDIFQWNNQYTRQHMKKLTDDERTKFNMTTSCYLCEKSCTDLVCDRDHFTGRIVFKFYHNYYAIHR